MNEEKTTTVIESPHSVKFGINAKGQYSGEVKAYGTTPDEAFERAAALALNVETIIREKNKLDVK